MTARLIYGSGAHEKALNLAKSLSKQVYEFGGEKLSTEDAKNATQKMVFAPIGTDTFCVVIGAVDNARGSATDALLKSIEEHPDFVVPILWANGLDGVPATIRSRCASEWTQDNVSSEIDPKFVRLVNASLSGNYTETLMCGSEIISESSTREMLVGFANALSDKSFEEPRVATLWSRVRESLQQHYPLSKTEALGVICI